MCLINHKPASRPGTGYKLYRKLDNGRYYAREGWLNSIGQIGDTVVAPKPMGFNRDLVDAQGFHIITKLEDAQQLLKMLDRHCAGKYYLIKVKYRQTLRRGYTRWFMSFTHRTVLAKEMTLIEEIE